MKSFLLGVLIFCIFILLAGSKYAYNPENLQNEFCELTKLCEVQNEEK